MKKGQFIIGVLVANQFGVLTRVSGLFARRGFNIDSLNVGETEDPTVSRMTIIASGDEHVKSQIVKQLAKLHDVKRVEIIPKDEAVIRELLLIKVQVTRKTRSEITEAANIFRASVIDFNADSMTIEMTGKPNKLDAFIEYLDTFGILEMCRAGALAVNRGMKSL